MRELHDCGYLHGDVKPENFCIGRPPQTRRVFILDLGMVRQWRKADGQIHTPRKVAAFRGNLKYASINALKHQEQSRRDDLWAWFYQTMGTLPWPAWIDAPDVFGQLNGFSASEGGRAQKPRATVRTSASRVPRSLRSSRHAHVRQPTKLYQPTSNLQKTFERKQYNDGMQLDWEEGGQFYKQTQMVPYDNRC